MSMHLLIDGIACASCLGDEVFLYDLLNTYPDKIGMVKVGVPTVCRFSTVNDNGLSGIVVIAESHISIHTSIPYKTVNIDIFSCKDFDHEKVLNDMQASFGLADVRFLVLERLSWENERGMKLESERKSENDGKRKASSTSRQVRRRQPVHTRAGET